MSAIAATELREGELERNRRPPSTPWPAFRTSSATSSRAKRPRRAIRAVRALLAKHKHLLGIDGEALAEILTHIEESLGERYAALLGR